MVRPPSPNVKKVQGGSRQPLSDLFTALVRFTTLFVARPLVAVQDYLPPAMHEAFLAITTEFVLLPWRYAMRTALEGASQGGSQVTHPYPPTIPTITLTQTL